MKNKYGIGFLLFLILVVFGITCAYYLKELNGYVVVYLSDKKTVYEYTDISLEDLPENLQKEIQNGKYIETSESLYGFLENYSS